MLQFSIGNGENLVNYEVDEIGEDFKVIVTGGDVHIGGIGLVSQGAYNILSVSNQKEFELIQPIADRLKKYTDINFLIVAGVYFEDISLDDIKSILENNERAIDKIEKYLSIEYDIFHEFR
jgi:hypothetical protein